MVIKPGTVCKHCGGTFRVSDPHYFNPSKGHYDCKTCAEKTLPDKKGTAKFLDEHHLIFLKLKHPGREFIIHKKDLGTSPFVEEENQAHSLHSGMCNGCRESPMKGYRFVYLVKEVYKNDFSDLCQKCFETASGDVENDEKGRILEAIRQDNVDVDNLVFLRICFNTGGYYKYQGSVEHSSSPLQDLFCCQVYLLEDQKPLSDS
eukprot:TRINITY_DN10082_c0_g3_i1.p1 TRINITY_DN10082_c0_g3~~TRINITY_DN10082_c0_g3_i1.p1  ORF type:complete len:204 (+),score=10.42 TRINITY_DN10082_c0_g3_i1:230-841(+)